MRARQIAVVMALVAVGIAGVAVPTVADMATQTQEESDGLGAEMTSFAQSTAADTSSTVDREMWEVAINQSEDPDTTVSDRATELEQRLTQLERRADQLSQNGSTSPGYTARATAIRAEIANIQSAIESANKSATRRGVDASKLERLRSEAANMTGPELRGVARNITDAPRGPDDTPGQSGDTPGNAEDPPGQSDNNQGNAGDNPGNAGDNPGQSDDGSGNAGNNPGQSGNNSGNSDNPSGSGEEGDGGNQPNPPGNSGQ